MEREALADIPNIYNYQAFVETEKAGYIIRQWLASSLYDRIRCAFRLHFGMQTYRVQHATIFEYGGEEMDIISDTECHAGCTKQEDLAW